MYVTLNVIWVIKSKRRKRKGHGACTKKIRNAYKILLGGFEGKRPLGRHRYRCGYNIKMETKLYFVRMWTGSQQEHVSGTCIHGKKNFRFHSMGNLLTNLTISFSNITRHRGDSYTVVRFLVIKMATMTTTLLFS